jgi:hypothetical protein
MMPKIPIADDSPVIRTPAEFEIMNTAPQKGADLPAVRDENL